MSDIHLEYGYFYHIYNCGINGENLFIEDDNYRYFMRLYDKHISPVAETYAWCLMKNHFHFVVKIKNSPVKSSSPDRVLKTKPPHQYFSNLFNAYAKAFNKKYDRHGSLFERPFKKKFIDNNEYLRRVIVYTHDNPVHHGFVSHTIEWPWSSYITVLSSEPTKIKGKRLLNYLVILKILNLFMNKRLSD